MSLHKASREPASYIVDIWMQHDMSTRMWLLADGDIGGSFFLDTLILQNGGG